MYETLVCELQILNGLTKREAEIIVNCAVENKEIDTLEQLLMYKSRIKEA